MAPWALGWPGVGDGGRRCLHLRSLWGQSRVWVGEECSGEGTVPGLSLGPSLPASLQPLRLMESPPGAHLGTAPLRSGVCSNITFSTVPVLTILPKIANSRLSLLSYPTVFSLSAHMTHVLSPPAPHYT